MRLVSFKKIPHKDQKLLLLAKNTAERSVSQKGHKVGCIVLCLDGSTYFGATVARTRVIGSTCAERMALDQWHFSGSKSNPVTCYLVGKFNRKSWKDNSICTSCGVCLEMFLELIVQLGLKGLKFVCSDWNLNKVLLTDIKELFPQYGKGGWPYVNNIGIR